MHTKTIRVAKIPISDNYFVILFNALSPQFHEYSNKTINDEQKGRLKLLVTTRKKVLVILRFISSNIIISRYSVSLTLLPIILMHGKFETAIKFKSLSML